MNISLFNQNRNNEQTSYGESVRLSNELRYFVGGNRINLDGDIVYDKPRLWGFDVETANYNKFTFWLNDVTIKKSQSLFWFAIRIMAWRFQEKHTEIKTNLSINDQLEFDLILSQMKKETEWVGTVSYANMVRLDGSLSNNKNKVVKGNNDDYKIIRK